MDEQKPDDQLRTYIQQLCADPACSPEDLPEAMDERCGEKGSGISMLMAQPDNDEVEVANNVDINSTSHQIRLDTRSF